MKEKDGLKLINSEEFDKFFDLFIKITSGKKIEPEVVTRKKNKYEQEFTDFLTAYKQRSDDRVNLDATDKWFVLNYVKKINTDCDHQWYRTTKNYKPAKKCYICKEVRLK